MSGLDTGASPHFAINCITPCHLKVYFYTLMRVWSCWAFGVKAQETMTVNRDPADSKAAPATGTSNTTGTPERRFREFIEFFGSLVGLVFLGLGVLPDSTVVEKLLVVLAAFALSFTILLAIRLVPKSRAGVQLAVSGVVSIACLATLSMVAQGSAASPSPAASGESAPRGSTGPPVTPQSSSSSSTTPPMTGVLPSTQTGYSLDYKNAPFTMSGESCGYIGTDFSSYASFTQSSPKVTVSDNFGGNLDIGCGDDAADVEFIGQAGQVAQLNGNPTPAQCAATITTRPLVGTIGFDELESGEEFCFIAGSGYPPGPLVLVTLKSVAGSPTFAITWAATAWQMPFSN
jgi:hypothetical protein